MMSNTEIKDEPSPIIVKEESQVKSIAIEDEPADDTNEFKNNASSDTDEEANDKIPFPVVLHELVSDPETDYCIHWLDDGGDNNDLFTISDKKRFAKEILPKLNGQSNKAKYTSFTRRLKRWGFHRIASGAQIGAYGNPHFLKDEPERVKNMRYMLHKPLSLTAVRDQNVKLQIPTMNITGGGSGAFSQVPTEELRMLQTMLAQQQQVQSNNPMKAYMRLVAGGNGVSANNNIAAANNNNSNNPMMQLALLQQMHQNQNTTAAATTSSADSSKANESYGQMLIRTNPALAAKVLDASFNTKGNNNMMSASSSVPSNPIMSMLATGQTNNSNNSMPMQQQHTMYPMRSQGYPLNLNAMLLALSQQEQQQQQQQKELIKSLANNNRGPTLTLNHQHVRADVNRHDNDDDVRLRLHINSNLHSPSNHHKMLEVQCSENAVQCVMVSAPLNTSAVSDSEC
eukprot:scaffold249336_cov57-Cyclotella_meneghiniana.AAC.1